MLHLFVQSGSSLFITAVSSSLPPHPSEALGLGKALLLSFSPSVLSLHYTTSTNYGQAHPHAHPRAPPRG